MLELGYQGVPLLAISVAMAEGLLDSYTDLLRSEQSVEELLVEMESRNCEGGGVEYSSDSEAEEEGVEGERKGQVGWQVEEEGSRSVVNAAEQSKGGAESLSFNDMDYLYPLHQERVELTDVDSLLSVALRRADEVTQQGEDTLAVKWRIKCVALVRLVFGDGHWRLGQAHCQLARAYLELRDMPQQALQHALQAKEILLSPETGLSIPTAPAEGKTSIIWAFITIGHAYLRLNKQEEAEKAFKRARREASKVSTLPCMKEVPQDIQLRVAVGLGRARLGLRKYEDALDSLKKAVELVHIGNEKQTNLLLSLLQDIAESCSGTGDHGEAISKLEEALALAQKEYGAESRQSAEVAQRLAKLIMKQTDKDKAKQDRVEALMLEAYRCFSQLELQDMAAQCLEQLCKYYVEMDRTKDAVLHLKTVVKIKKTAFGDPSTELGDSHRLLGTIYLSEGDVASAEKHLKQSLEQFKVTLGRKHKTTVEVEETLRLMAFSKSRAKSAADSRPRFQTVFRPSAGVAQSVTDLQPKGGPLYEKGGPLYDSRPPFSTYLKHDAFW